MYRLIINDRFVFNEQFFSSRKFIIKLTFRFTWCWCTGCRERRNTL